MASTLDIADLDVVTDHRGHTHSLVSRVSLSVERGRILALVGASGSGKSLTCAACLDALPPGVRRTSGTVSLDGVPQPPAALRGRQIATILQNPRSAFNPVRSMADHAQETLKALGQEGGDARARILSAMQAVGLEDPDRVMGLYPFEMSGGMLQRMMIALAVLTDAPFLFADEPTTDLDLVVQARILDLIGTIVRERTLGVLLVTHDMGVVARLADTVAVMDAGMIVERGDVETIFRAPRHPVTRGLIAAHLSLYGLEMSA